MELEQIRKELRRHKWKEVAEETGLSYLIIRGIAKGITEKPGYEDIVKIIEFLEREKEDANVE